MRAVVIKRASLGPFNSLTRRRPFSCPVLVLVPCSQGDSVLVTAKILRLTIFCLAPALRTQRKETGLVFFRLLPTDKIPIQVQVGLLHNDDKYGHGTQDMSLDSEIYSRTIAQCNSMLDGDGAPVFEDGLARANNNQQGSGFLK